MAGRHRKLTGVQVLTDDCSGDEVQFIGRMDEFETALAFKRAARKEADYLGYQDCALADVREVLLRVSPPFGGEYDYLIKEVEKPGPGVWRSWKTELSDDERPRYGCCAEPIEWGEDGEPMKETCEVCGCDVCPDCDQYGNTITDHGTLCPSCYAEEEKSICKTCEGEGEIEVKNSPLDEGVPVDCPDCGGTGRLKQGVET